MYSDAGASTYLHSLSGGRLLVLAETIWCHLFQLQKVGMSLYYGQCINDVFQIDNIMLP